MSDLPSQYPEEVETFRQILDLPDPRETLPRSSTTVLGLDDEKGQKEVRPRGLSAMLPLNPVFKDSFEKFEQNLFTYLGIYVAFNTVQVISRWVVGRAEETSTYSLLGFCTVNC